MIVPFVRSSSYGTYKLCQFSWFLQYNLGWNPPSNMAADRGSIVHKALETVARAKLAQQRGERSFIDPELCGGTDVGAGVSDEEAMDLAWRHYTDGPAGHHRWTARDRDECDRLFRVALDSHGGEYNPRRRTVVQPEQYFDITVDEDWAAYSDPLPGGGVLEGRLALKGTVDLVLEGPDGSIEYCDWKTGRMIDWATGRAKTAADLYDDFQLRLYHLALSRLYPDRDVILMTIFFLRHRPFTLAFERAEVHHTLGRVRSWFEEVRRTAVPERRIGPPCTTFCKFGTTAWRDQRYVEPGTDPHGDHLSVCDHVHAEVQQLGVDRVVAKYGRAKWGHYGAGGGSQNRE